MDAKLGDRVERGQGHCCHNEVIGGDLGVGSRPRLTLTRSIRNGQGAVDRRHGNRSGPGETFVQEIKEKVNE